MPKIAWSFVGAWAAVLGLCEPVPARTDVGIRMPHGERELDVHDWKIIDRESGPVNYYSVVEGKSFSHIHAAYRPGLETTVLGYEIDGPDQRARKLRWSWRAIALPHEGNECVGGLGDSAAGVYVTWKRGFKWYTLKYTWSAMAPKGSVCDRRRNAFVAQDTIVLESARTSEAWVDEEIDLAGEFRRAFENGDPDAEVPDLQGVGIMSDGDQTKSDSIADYAKFVLVR